MNLRLRVVSTSGRRNVMSLMLPASCPATVTGPPSRRPLALSIKLTSWYRLPNRFPARPTFTMAMARMMSAMIISTPTLSWSQVMNDDRFIGYKVSPSESGRPRSESTQEFANVGIIAARHFLRRAEESNAVMCQQCDLARHSERRPDVVRHDKARDAQLPLQLDNEVGDGRGRQRIEARSRLVEEHDLGMVSDSVGDAHPLFHSAR